MFVGFIIYFLYHVINKIRKQKRKYFKSFWNMLELVTVIMAVLTCAMYGAKIMFGNAAMDTLRETGSGKTNSGKRKPFVLDQHLRFSGRFPGEPGLSRSCSVSFLHLFRKRSFGNK